MSSDRIEELFLNHMFCRRFFDMPIRPSTYLRTACALTCLVGWFAHDAEAQRLPGLPGSAPIRGTGEILNIRPGLLQLQAADGEKWLLKLEAPPTRVQVRGTAEPSWLRPGMLVRFSTTLDNQGNSETPIEQLYVFTPRPEYRIGVFAEVAFTSDEPPADEPKRLRRKRGERSAGPFLVAGRLASLKEGNIRVNAGRRAIQAKLADNAKIEVDVLGDYSMVRRGDHVDFKGRFYKKGEAVANELTFTTAKAFSGEPQGKPRRRTSSSGRRGRDRGTNDPNETAPKNNEAEL